MKGAQLCQLRSFQNFSRFFVCAERVLLEFTSAVRSEEEKLSRKRRKKARKKVEKAPKQAKKEKSRPELVVRNVKSMTTTIKEQFAGDHQCPAFLLLIDDFLQISRKSNARNFSLRLSVSIAISTFICLRRLHPI